MSPDPIPGAFSDCSANSTPIGSGAVIEDPLGRDSAAKVTFDDSARASAVGFAVRSVRLFGTSLRSRTNAAGAQELDS